MHFPLSALETHNLLPRWTAVEQDPLFFLQKDPAHRIPVSIFQLNFINGGIIIASAIHHLCSDGPGCDAFLTTWAESSAAIAAGRPCKPIDSSNRDTSRFVCPKPDAARWQKLDKQYPLLKNILECPLVLSADYKMPIWTSQIWHFSRYNLQELKVEASLGLGDSWISTYDAVLALLWKATTRARIFLRYSDLKSKASLGHAVNMRHRIEPSLPDRYLGNAVVTQPVGSMTVDSILLDDSLPRLASAIRSSIKRVTPEYSADLLEWVAGLENDTRAQYNVIDFLGIDLVGSSWQDWSAYTRHDFGFGVPKALRSSFQTFGNFAIFLPSRACQVGGDEGLEVNLCLETASAGRLMDDELMLKYAELRG